MAQGLVKMKEVKMLRLFDSESNTEEKPGRSEGEPIHHCTLIKGTKVLNPPTIVYYDSQVLGHRALHTNTNLPPLPYPAQYQY